MILDAVTAAGARKTVFTRSDLAAEVATRIPADAAVDATTMVEWVERLTDRALATSEAVELLPEHDGPVRASDARYAAATTLAQELAIVSFAENGRRAGAAICPHPTVQAACDRHGLDPAQERAVHWITRAGERLSVLVAPAGTGKTTTLAAMVDAWQATGRQVIALAPSARAAKELAAATGLRADTVAKYLHENAPEVWPVAPRYRLAPGVVMIVDETSMLSTADLHALAGHVQAVDGKLLAVGDPAQIGAIDAAGGMLPALADRLGAPSLTTVHRMNRLWERHASLQLRAGDPACITTYLEHDRVHPIGPDTDPYQQVLTDYRHLTRDGSRVLLLARSHDDVDALNAHARQGAMSSGDVRGDPLLTAGGRDWREGDLLRVTRNDRRITVGTDHLRNGDLFTVTGHTELGLTVQHLDSPDTTVLPRDYLAQHARYGWASTIDSAQGATVDHSLLLARPGLDRSRLYVAMTRGRQTNHVYLAPAPDPEITPRDSRPQAIDPASQLAQMLHRTGENAAAHTRLPEPDRPAATPRHRAQRRTFTEPPRPVPRRDTDRDQYLAAEHQRHLAREHDRGYGRSR